jgi:hypothetical protein
MSTDSRIRASLVEMERVSRRSFFTSLIKGVGIASAFDKFGPGLFAADSEKSAAETRLPYLVYSALGKLTIPVDEDPGWATFEPGITAYGVDVFVRQVLLGGNFLAFLGFLNSLSAINEVPVLTGYGPRFLNMSPSAQDKYYSDMLTGQFENDGVQDILGFASGLTLISTKGVFFSNYPQHLAVPGAEFQVRKPFPVKTGWDIMKLKGPVGPEEEKQLRDKYFDSEELAGVDPTNPYI